MKAYWYKIIDTWLIHLHCRVLIEGTAQMASANPENYEPCMHNSYFLKTIGSGLQCNNIVSHGACGF